MESPIFFTKQYALTSNLGRAVGFMDDNILVLHRTSDRKSFETKPLHCSTIRGIRVRRYLSIYVLVLAVGAAAIALFIAYLGIADDVGGPGIFTIPIVSGLFSYYAFTGAKRIRIDIDTFEGGLVWKSSFRDAIDSISPLEQFAGAHRIPIVVEFAPNTSPT